MELGPLQELHPGTSENSGYREVFVWKAQIAHSRHYWLFVGPDLPPCFQIRVANLTFFWEMCQESDLSKLSEVFVRTRTSLKAFFKLINQARLL
jgi:hypothetical protein